MKIEEVEKLVTNLHDKKEYAIHIRNIKRALNHRLVLKNVHRVIEFNQKPQVRSYIDINTKLRENAKNYFEIDFFKLMNNTAFGKTMGDVRNHRDIKLRATKVRRDYLLLETNYYTINFFFRKFVSNRNEKETDTHE